MVKLSWKADKNLFDVETTRELHTLLKCIEK